MPEKVLDQVMDVMDNVPEDFHYDMLKAHLLETHTLSDHKNLDVLYKSEPLGGQKPSYMLAIILAYSPSGMEQTIMFQYMFMQRLSVTLRTLLGKQEPGDIRSLAARADKLWATHKPQSHDLVANVNKAEEQPDQIAAVQKKEPGSQIPDPDPKTASKERGEKKIVVLPFFCSHKNHKISNYINFELVKRKMWANLQRILFFTYPGAQIPNPGIKKVPDP
jgi:hypothetical protein